MSRRGRLLAYGTAAALVVAGGLCAALVDSEFGQLLTIGLLSIGIGGVVLLVFFEIGLSEDRERARARERKRRRAPKHPESRSRPLARRRPRRPG
jgi:hypothetical protein